MKALKKSICCLLACALLLLALTACSKPPEYTEIEARFKELVEQSAELNRWIFGEGLPTYERIYDPLSSLKVHTVTDPESGEVTSRTFYYEIQDPSLGKVVAFRSSYLDDYSYVQVFTSGQADRDAYYVDEENGAYCYLLSDYTPPEYEFFYDADDPSDYDFVRLDCGYLSIAQMKEKAEQVYSPEYLESIYEWLFVGTASITESVEGLSARYMEYTDDEGMGYLMRSNTFEPLITEQRMYDFSTASIVKPANKEYVNIELDSYLPSNPEQVLRVRLSMQLVDGVWLLDSATY